MSLRFRGFTPTGEWRAWPFPKTAGIGCKESRHPLTLSISPVFSRIRRQKHLNTTQQQIACLPIILIYMINVGMLENTL
jgi:hypothetical protein